MQFYDDIAEYYDLIFSDWEGSMREQGAAIAVMLDDTGWTGRDRPKRILDVAAGIGTQSLALAALGCAVTARDLFGSAIAIPHLLSDEEIAATLRGFRGLLGPDGLLLLSVRDYDQVDRTSPSYHPYGKRTRGGRVFRLAQEWVWIDESHYRTSMIIEERQAEKWNEIVRTDTVYYAVSRERLLELMMEAGFSGCRASEVPFYQPVLVGHAG